MSKAIAAAPSASPAAQSRISSSCRATDARPSIEEKRSRSANAAARPAQYRPEPVEHRGQHPVRGPCDGHGTIRLPEDAAINIKTGPSPFSPRSTTPDGNAEGMLG